MTTGQQLADKESIIIGQHAVSAVSVLASTLKASKVKVKSSITVTLH
jgi:hypothetical protein